MGFKSRKPRVGVKAGQIYVVQSRHGKIYYRVDAVRHIKRDDPYVVVYECTPTGRRAKGRDPQLGIERGWDRPKPLVWRDDQLVIDPTYGEWKYFGTATVKKKQ